MVRKKKFKPVITRVKLNPEQAVLACDCYHSGFSADDSGFNSSECYGGGKELGNDYFGFSSSSSSS